MKNKTQQQNIIGKERCQKTTKKFKTVWSQRLKKERISRKVWSTVLNPRIRLRRMKPQKME